MNIVDLVKPVLDEFPQITITRKGESNYYKYKTHDFPEALEAAGDYDGVWFASFESTKIHVHVIPTRFGTDQPQDIWFETIDVSDPNIDITETLRALIKTGITKVDERSVKRVEPS